LELGSTEDAFLDLRARFADTRTLQLFYDNNKWSLVAAVKLAAMVGYADGLYLESQALFDKPFERVLASAAGRWYGRECWKGTPGEACNEVAGFSDAFIARYGVEATPNRAWMLAFLNRRYLEGGEKLVVIYQQIAKDFGATQISEKKPGG
jgi:hypothetical protein